MKYEQPTIGVWDAPEPKRDSKTGAHVTSKTVMENKTLDNVNIEDVKKKVSDVKVFGNGDLFRLIAKASSESQGWMKSTKAMECGGGCVVQVTTQQKNPDGSYAVAEALTFVPFCTIKEDDKGNLMIA